MALTQDNRQLQISTPLGKDFLILKEFSASEALSELYSFQLKLVHEEDSAGFSPTVVDPKQLLGQPIGIQIIQVDKTSRYFHGVVSHWQQGNRDGRFTYYRAIVVPKIWLLTQRRQSRIFQRVTVPEILQKVFSGFDVKYELPGSFNKRDYCVQYQETDFDFASRLMEEEGIYYYFEHTANNHLMIVANTPQSHRSCPVKSKIPFITELTGEAGFVSGVRTWDVNYQLQTGKITVWDHNFELPHKKLDADEPSAFQVAANAQLEFFQYPGDYAKRYTGINKGGGDQTSELQHIFADNQRQAKLQMQAIDAGYKTGVGTSDCCALTAGHKFDLFNHPTKESNTKYVVTRIWHDAQQSPALESGEETDNAYTNDFNCITAKGTPFRPPRNTPKPRINGSQTAVVVGPAGEEIFTDKYGRIKVQFHWDRHGRNDIESSCWMRVAQPWAGGGWGTIAVPRIGQEVVVDFLEGDPDRPLVTGSVYNPAQMPPYALPGGANMMGFKSNTTKGGGGYNEIVIVDGKAGELIRMHAQKDMDTTVENDDRQYVLVNRDIKVDGKQTETVKGDMSTIVTEGNQTNVVTAGNQANEVTAGNQANVVKAGDMGHQAKGNIVILSEAGVVHIEAATKIEIVVGASSLAMDAGGNITLKGTNVTVIGSSAVNLNP